MVGGEASSSKTPVPARPPAPESASWATWATTSTTPPAGRLKTAVPAPYASTTASGTRIAGRYRATSTTSAPAIRAIIATAPCHSGNA